MKITNRYIAVLTLTFALAVSGNPEISAQKAKESTRKEKSDKKEKSDTTKVTKSPYEKLFEKKKDVKTSKGIMTLHKIESKLYLEVPVKLMGESFLMSSVIENVSNMGLSYAGQRTARPQHISFSKTDSLVQIRLVNPPQLTNENDKGIKEALRESSVPPIINSTPIVAWNPDSTSVVFEATSFFVSGNKYIGTLNASSFGGFIQKVSSFSKDLSSLKDVAAYEENVSILSDMTYTFKTFFLGMESGGSEYLTAELKTTISRLPAIPFTPRVADYRIGTEVTDFQRFSSEKQGVESEYFASRWRIEPENKEAYIGGELSKPVKPIVFYVDTLFTPSWRAAVKRGILKWNKAFESAGFKDVIEVYDYPSAAKDSLFDAANISYNVVRYAQIPSRNIGRQINIDPRTGEILSASILFFRDAPITLQRERLYQTAEVEPGVRSYELPDNLMCDAIELATTREAGFCLGLTANFAASSWMNTDSLRSPSFTAREGITSSVMDQIKYNYVARPGDIEKGVKLTADRLGVYDLYAIDWLYRLYPQGVNEKEALNKKIEEKASDRRFLYGKQQNWSAYFDPRSAAEDLGNDKIASTRYGVETLKYISENATDWVNKDNVDESYRELFVDFIFLKIYDYYRSLMVNIGGIEINPRYEGDPAPSYVPVSRKIQKETLAYMLEQADNMDWLDNKKLLQMSGMNASLSTYFANNLASLPLQRIAMVAFTQQKTHPEPVPASYDGPYTVDEMIGDMLNFALKNISRGNVPTKTQKAALFATTQLLLNNSALPVVEKARAANAKTFQLVETDGQYSYQNLMARCYPHQIETEPVKALHAGIAYALAQTSSRYNIAPSSSFEVLTSIKYLTNQDISPVFYKHLLELRKQLGKASRRASDDLTKSQINYLIQVIDKGIK